MNNCFVVWDVSTKWQEQNGIVAVVTPEGTAHGDAMSHGICGTRRTTLSGTCGRKMMNTRRILLLMNMSGRI